MRRMNLRDVPEDVYRALAQSAADNRQSLNAYVVEQLTEVVRMQGVAGYLDSYAPPRRTNVTFEEAVQAVREVRSTS